MKVIDKLQQIEKDIHEEWQLEGADLKECREYSGFSMAYIARRLSISPGRLRRLEQGKPVRDANMIREFCYQVFNSKQDHQMLEQLTNENKKLQERLEHQQSQNPINIVIKIAV